MKSALIALILAFGFYAPVCAAEPSASEPSAATTDSIRKQAEQGNAQAQYDLGEMYEWGMHGVERDYAQALFWYRKAAEQGQYLADRKVSLVEEKWRNALGDAELPALRALAKNGNAFAQYELGLRYESGWDVAQDEAAAAEWYRKAAEQGDREAAAGLGSLYADGRGVARDAAQAEKWYRKAYGDSYDERLFGTSALPDDEQAALNDLRAQAERGNAEAQYMLGALYENGIANNGNRDSAQAAAWIRKSAEQGYAKAQLAFGLMLAGDLAKYGVEKDEAQGAAWLRKAADQGNADAQYWLGRFYAQGHGVEKDRDQARLWYGKAAEQGHAEAQEALRDWETHEQEK